MDRESAISKNIILALVAAVVIIMAVMVVVMIFFPPQPDIVPQFNANIERSGNIVYLYHDGGDPLQKGRTIVRINGNDIPESSIAFLHAQDWPWTPGKTMRIQYDGPGIPALVQVIYSGGSGEMLVFSDEAAAVQETPIPVSTVPTAVTTTPPGATATPTGAGAVTSPVSPAATGTTPSAPQPPQAAFTADPRAGQLPLAVQFTDTSAGTPTSWLWNFGDGETSDQKNPVHTYKNPGMYSVSLTVRNQYGTSQKTETGFISAGTLPVAQFTALPAEGTLPLIVHFTDLSTGLPTAYAWDFGDKATSNEKNPLHTYTKAGTYDVTLTVGNEYGYNTRIQTGAVQVKEPERVDIYLTGSRMGTLSTGYLQFLVTGEGGWIKIAGSTYPFSPGDTVQLFVDQSQSGMIDVNARGIAGFRFDNVRMFVNGNPARSGISTDIFVPSFAGLQSTLAITIPPGDATTVLFINNGRIIPGSAQQVIISNLAENSQGQMSLGVKLGSVEYRGGAGSYTVS
jgi:PKD repeat protein